MKARKQIIALAVCLLAGIFASTASAQGLKDLLGGKAGDAVKDFINDKLGVQADITGTWTFTGSACKFESENLLKQAGGAVMANKLTEELDGVLEKVGIKEGNMTYTFNADSTFTSKTRLGDKKGTYSMDQESKKLQLRYVGGLLKSSCTVSVSDSELQMLYDADKLKEIITIVGGKSNIQALELLAKLMEQYDGCMLGFKFKKE